MRHGGSAADPPEQYLLIRAARYLHVPPWELARQPVYWRNWALLCDACEIDAENYHNERAARAARTS